MPEWLAITLLVLLGIVLLVPFALLVFIAGLTAIGMLKGDDDGR